MPKLTKDTIQFYKLKRAEANGEIPSLIFKIKDRETLDKFLQDPSIGYLWGGAHDLKTCRLAYEIVDDFLIISRSVVKNRTWWISSTWDVAQYTLQYIYDADTADFPDIWVGMTSSPQFPRGWKPYEKEDNDTVKAWKNAYAESTTEPVMTTKP